MDSPAIILVPLGIVFGLIFFIVTLGLPFYVRGIYIELKKSNDATRAMAAALKEATDQARLAATSAQDLATLKRQLLRAYGYEPEV